MYVWLAQDLAERGYVVLTYDVQGQGTSETLPHETANALPFCNPFAAPGDGEMFGCPGVPFQQLSNFVVGTKDALDFFTSTPEHPYANPGSAGAPVSAHNPFASWFDRRRDPHPATPGRRMKLAIIGHSMGAAAVSKVQATDRRVAAVVALDKLSASGSFAPGADSAPNKPVVPALAVQSEYGFTVSPYWLSGEQLALPAAVAGRPGPAPRTTDRLRRLGDRRRGLDARRASGLDAPRLHRHPAGAARQPLRPGPDQRLRPAMAGPLSQAPPRRRSLLGSTFRYLEPVGGGRWSPVTLKRDPLLSFYYCSAYRLEGRHRVRSDGDVTGVGC